MDWLQILEKYGIAVAVAIAFAFYIWRQTKFIQDELQKELRESFGRVEGIIIKLNISLDKNFIICILRLRNHHH